MQRHEKLLQEDLRQQVVSYNTAITRSKPSLPLRSIMPSLKENSKVLDYGGGKGMDSKHLSSYGFESDCYDPYWNPIDLTKKEGYYDYVLCTYVLNVLPIEQQELVIDTALKYLKPDGILFVSVRRDIKSDSFTSRGYQRVVSLDREILTQKSGSFCTYKITRS